MLVQQLHFEEIYINFLIVNHTHNIIDQFFSILSKALGRCNWIGSPMSLVNLFDVCHHDIASKPGVQRELRVIYDVVKAWKPFINEDIKYYNVPHCFKIFMMHGQAIKQWKYVSSDREWKPRIPNLEAG